MSALLLLTLLAAEPVAAVPPRPFDKPPVAAEELRDARGGFALPGGLQVEIAVRTVTTVDGELRLRTEFATSGPGASLAFTGTSPEAITVERTGAGATVRFAQGNFAVSHLIGGPYGALVANGMDSVSINTIGQIDLTLHGATGFNLGSAGLRAQDLALASTASLAR